jgi:hypothetical protein
VTRTLVTVNASVRAGSAVARNPWRIHAWPPRATSSPTGRPVKRMLFAAALSIEVNPDPVMIE